MKLLLIFFCLAISTFSIAQAIDSDMEDFHKLPGAQELLDLEEIDLQLPKLSYFKKRRNEQ